MFNYAHEIFIVIQMLTSLSGKRKKKETERTTEENWKMTNLKKIEFKKKDELKKDESKKDKLNF